MCKMSIKSLFLWLIVAILGSVSSRAVTFPRNTVPMDPQGEDSTSNMCVNINNCPAALSLLKENKELVNQMHCGFEGNYTKVFCPVKESTIIFNNAAEEIATRKPSKNMTPKIEITSQETEFNTMIPESNSDQLPSRKICGQISLHDRIVGGLISSLDEFPWLARIKYLSKYGDENYACAASLITNQYLLTAAHCLSDKIGKPISVRLGEWDEQTERDCRDSICNDKPVDRNISKLIIYDGYDMKNLKSGDIALIKLDKPIRFTEFIAPVCLPNTEYVKQQDYTQGSTYWAAGWGLTEFNLPSPIKRKVDLNAVPSNICRNFYPKIPEESFETLICAGGVKGKDTCNGDSGGSLVKLVTEDYEKNWYLFGITSIGGRQCGTEGIPGIYTRITSYMDWIRKTIAK